MQHSALSVCDWACQPIYIFASHCSNSSFLKKSVKAEMNSIKLCIMVRCSIQNLFSSICVFVHAEDIKAAATLGVPLHITLCSGLWVNLCLRLSRVRVIVNIRGNVNGSKTFSIMALQYMNDNQPKGQFVVLTQSHLEGKGFGHCICVTYYLTYFHSISPVHAVPLSLFAAARKTDVMGVKCEQTSPSPIIHVHWIIPIPPSPQ